MTGKIAFLSSFAHLALDDAEHRVSGGAELQVALLARELAARGIEVVLLAGRSGQRDGEVRQGVRVRDAGNFHTGRMLQMLLALPRVLRVLAEERPQWVCVLGWTAWLFVLWLARRALGFRLAFICGLDTEVSGEFRRENPVRGALFEWAMRRCEARFAMTEWQRRLFGERGMDCGFYRNLILPRRAPLDGKKTVDFLWVARCRAIKNPLLFVELCRAFPGARCLMIAPAEDAELFRKIQEASQDLEHLEVIDGVPYHKSQEVYDSARIFVNTSEWEGWANSFIQAGLGRCAILSYKVRPDTLFDDYKLGFCAEGDWQKMVSLARQLFENPELCDECGKEAERFVRELHDNSRETSRFLEGLQAALNKKR